jgi:hypothetical protein
MSSTLETSGGVKVTISPPSPHLVEAMLTSPERAYLTSEAPTLPVSHSDGAAVPSPTGVDARS